MKTFSQCIIFCNLPAINLHLFLVVPLSFQSVSGISPDYTRLTTGNSEIIQCEMLFFPELQYIYLLSGIQLYYIQFYIFARLLVNILEIMKTTSEIARIISDKYAPLPPEQLERLAGIIESQQLHKGEIFLEEGETAKHFLYVESGMLRQFYYKNGHNITEHFSCEDSLVFCIISLFRKERTHLMIEALEPATIHKIPYTKLEELLSGSPEIALLYRKILECALIVSQEKADSWRFETARERYLRFCKEYPEAAKRAPMSHIASYLLMTPETLSRVRAEIH